VTSKDYRLIAEQLSRLEPMQYTGTDKELVAKFRGAYLQWGYTCCDFAQSFGADNPRFDRFAFLKACGYKN